MSLQVAGQGAVQEEGQEHLHGVWQQGDGGEVEIWNDAEGRIRNVVKVKDLFLLEVE